MTIGLVLGPFTALIRSFLNRCTLTNKAVGTQRRQGPDPGSLWVIVGTPSAFGPELAYRLCVAQPTLMDNPIYFWYAIIKVCRTKSTDLSVFVLFFFIIFFTLVGNLSVFVVSFLYYYSLVIFLLSFSHQCPVITPSIFNRLNFNISTNVQNNKIIIAIKFQRNRPRGAGRAWPSNLV